MSDTTLRIGLIGCGQIADAHLQQIRRVKGAEVVAVCDHEPLLARQAAERFEVPVRFSNSATMVQDARPDVVHITTPVHSHARWRSGCWMPACMFMSRSHCPSTPPKRER